MKKIILSAIAVFTFGFTNAQKAQFGLKGGLNIANQNFSSSDGENLDSDALVGFHIGGFVDIKIADKFSIQPEVLYSTQGTKPSLDEGDSEGFESFKTSYINVPVMVKYYAAKNFNLELGPQIGFLASAKIKANPGGNSIEVDAKQLYQSIDFGLNVGAGYDFTKNVSASVRYNFGLADIGAGEFGGNNIDINNNVLSISVAYKL